MSDKRPKWSVSIHQSHRAGGQWFQWGSGMTKREAWRAALEYATSRARIVEVQLPTGARAKRPEIETIPTRHGAWRPYEENQ